MAHKGTRKLGACWGTRVHGEVILERVVMQEMQFASFASSWHLARYIVGALPGIDTQGSYNSVARVATIQLPGIVLQVPFPSSEW